MKVKHTTIRNGALFCLNCGQKTALSLPIEISKLSQKIRAFNLLHEDCPKTWEEPKPNQAQSIEERAKFWFEHGERGLSSEAIFSFFLKKPGYTNHPLDPSDFKRCFGLLEFVPEWRKRILEISTLSPEWNVLAANWETLENLYLSAKESNKQKDWGEMYEFMQKLFKKAKNQ